MAMMVDSMCVNDMSVLIGWSLKRLVVYMNSKTRIRENRMESVCLSAIILRSAPMMF